MSPQIFWVTTRIVAPILVLLLIFIGLWQFQGQKKSENAEFSQKTDSSSQANLNDPLGDPDNDGLRNWEENLYQTDPNNADTDGDGTPDGEEIKEGRDPTKPGPNDLLSLETIKNIVATQNGSAEAQNGKNTFSGHASSSTSIPASDSNANENSKVVLHAYGNTIANLIKTQASSYNLALETAFSHTVKENGVASGSDFDTFASVALSYNDLSASIGNINAPDEVKTLNRTLSSAYKGFAGGLEQLSSYKSTLKIPIEAAKSFNTSSAELTKAFVAVSLYLKQQGVAYSITEPGYIFTLP